MTTINQLNLGPCKGYCAITACIVSFISLYNGKLRESVGTTEWRPLKFM